ncbi:protein associated with topo II related - 1 isoform X2 [Arctopsyche grandis]|uniref:protein associated with topo II related - 1 isoform X2 n=1 Tax=Arctopsyche grandis TaxID=121162 RepID=UPI00406D76B5
MADEFFGFKNLDEINLEDVEGVFEASEDEYDALNDETFGEMVDDGDWEQQHEEFTLLTEKGKHIDIEESLSNLMIDNEKDRPLLSHHQNVIKPHPLPLPGHVPQSLLPQIPSLALGLRNVCTVEELERNLRQQQQPQMQQSQSLQSQQNSSVLPFFHPRFSANMMGPPPPIMGGQHPFMGPPPGQPMPSYRMPQIPPNQMGQHPYGNFNMLPPNNLSPGNVPNRPPPPGIDQHQNLFHQMHFNQHSNNFNNQQQPSNNLGQQRFPQQPIPYNKQQFSPNQQPPQNQQVPQNQNQQQQFFNNQQFPHGQQQFSNQQFPTNQMPPNQQMPMNQHGNLNQQPMPQNRISQNQQNNVRNQQQNNMNQQNTQNQQMINKMGNLAGVPPNNRSYSNFPNGTSNKNQSDTNNLIQMIQNTHPMLQNNMHTGFVNAIVANSMLARGMFRNSNNASGYNNNNNNQQGNMQRNPDGSQRRHGGADVDPYSGLMSTREKQWLMNIQMMQLNTGTPYIDDYYYTVFLERKAKKKKEEVREAHKVNQENHPFSQQNLANNKYRSGNQGGNEGGRERCNSTRSNNENNPHNKDGPRIYVPTQFENSLGKLQCGSVTAPRKIIDMEVIGCESPTGESRSSGTSSVSAGVIGAPRGTRHVLLAIETLYRILLRLEDLSEPLAIANAVVLKEREEKQKASFIDQLAEALHKNDCESYAFNDLSAGIGRAIENVVKMNNKLSISSDLLSLAIAPTSTPNLLDENKPDLLGKIFSGLLFEDRLLSFMNIRKGKMLVLRTLAQAVPTERWRTQLGRIWPRLLRALPMAIRRDANVLNPLIGYFQQYLSGTEGWAPVSNLCLMLSEGSGSAPVPQRASSVPLRSATPSLPQRSLMHFIMSTTLGLDILVTLMKRASVLPKPAPAAWNSMVRCASRLVTVSGSTRPTIPIARNLLATHAAAADLANGIEESLVEVLCQH